MNAFPKRPNPGTGNARLLDAMLANYPEPVWNADSGLQMKANSRASNLRQLGWTVTCVRRTVTTPTGKRVEHGYFVSLPEAPFGTRPAGAVA